MFDFYNFNNSIDIPKVKVKKFIKNGLIKISSRKNSNEKISLEKTRNIVEEIFKKKGYPKIINLDEIDNQEFQEIILKNLSNPSVKKFFKELSKESGEEVTLFPYIHLMRNYFSGPQNGLHGWHNDAIGEYFTDYGKMKLSSKKYVFGKISISLQKNGIFGGNIDIAKATFKRSSRISLRQKFLAKSTGLFFQIFNNSPSIPSFFGDKWLTDFFSFFVKPKTLNPEPFDVIAFEHRLFHRGTPPSPKGWNKLLKKYPLLKINNHKISGEFDLKDKNKYIIYAHFGNFTGLESYLHTRSLGNYYADEIKIWKNQYEELKIFKKFFKNSHKLFNQGLNNLKI